MDEEFEEEMAVSQVTPGMRLTAPVVNELGVTLMPAGIRLTPMFILRLKKWGIQNVVVIPEVPVAAAPSTAAGPLRKGVKANAPLADQSDFARAITEEVADWFANVADNTLMMQLKAVATRKLIHHGEEGIVNLMRRLHPGAAEGK